MTRKERQEREGRQRSLGCRRAQDNRRKRNKQIQWDEGEKTRRGEDGKSGERALKWLMNRDTEVREETFSFHWEGKGPGLTKPYVCHIQNRSDVFFFTASLAT